MAETKKTAVPTEVDDAGTAELIAKSEYDTVVREYQRVAAAFNKAIGIIADNYAEKVAKAIFDEVDKSTQK